MATLTDNATDSACRPGPGPSTSTESSDIDTDEGGCTVTAALTLQQQMEQAMTVSMGQPLVFSLHDKVMLI